MGHTDMTTPDIGNAHVIDWYMYCALAHFAYGRLYDTGDRADPEDWTRYDGELL